MKKSVVYSNGKSLFTLVNYGPNAGTSTAHGIIRHGEISEQMKRKLHSDGALHYVFGVGDRKALKGIDLKRNTIVGDFEIL
jgi:hypothetical protein